MAHCKLSAFMSSPLFRKVIEKRRLMWISVFSYTWYNIVFLASDITYAVYHPNKL